MCGVLIYIGRRGSDPTDNLHAVAVLMLPAPGVARTVCLLFLGPFGTTLTACVDVWAGRRAHDFQLGRLWQVDRLTPGRKHPSLVARQHEWPSGWRSAANLSELTRQWFLTHQHELLCPARSDDDLGLCDPRQH